VREKEAFNTSPHPGSYTRSPPAVPRSRSRDAHRRGVHHDMLWDPSLKMRDLALRSRYHGSGSCSLPSP
jgi:hypothetical protein